MENIAVEKSNEDRPSNVTDERVKHSIRAPSELAEIVADSSTGTWKNYCDSRLEHFALAR
jgi:hypothetical protein